MGDIQISSQKMLLDASARGSMMTKDVVEATAIIESLSTSDHQVQHDRSQPNKRVIMELDT